ncbi:laminin subunit gamma-3 isoform X1 [Pantherophis guttatus]|uniref:Laminin subunit gamma-3 isoform X1 n=1 Tax=Pantherophis guttatus TaxID=94885 RepID=A0ABM3YUY3_PANGU|nr:laminin subunit gamma-3 isoform X1 [Pantherophis guttatus]
MAQLLLCSLAFVVFFCLAKGAMDVCYNSQGRAQRCMPIFENAAFSRQAQSSNTCGWPPETYCLQMGTRESSTLCHRCDAEDPLAHHNASYLTDFHSQEEPTWWQSQSMAFGVQHPTSVNITLHLGKSYEITYVRLKFHTSRPESFAIYKRSRAEGPWIPYQFYSASCKKTYGKAERQFLRSGEHEQAAFCTDEFSDISPLSGGNVAFSTLEGRPSAYSFDQSPLLQEWVTCTDLLISLDRLNTFGDDIFKDPKVLQSYYYAISDFSVGGRCKCNGHASECIPNEEDQLICLCQHNTTGVDCDMCQPFYQDRPWARGTAESANECLPCNCSGRSEECYYDWELYRRTGHGGHCVNCRDNTAGPHCEYCRPNFYRWDDEMVCQPCNCNRAGSLNPQCDAAGKCECKVTVTGWKCERCQEGFHSLSEGGCRPCACNSAGSLGVCDPNSGHCRCKKKVEGYLCNRCQPGSFNLQPHNSEGCTSCFCYGHSTVCATAPGYEPRDIVSDFRQGIDGWKAENSDGREILLRWDGDVIFVDQNEREVTGFKAPEKFLGDQRFSYGQLLSAVLHFGDNATDVPSPSVQLILEGNGVFLSARHEDPEEKGNEIPCKERIVSFRLHEAEEAMNSVLSPFQFQRMLSNLTKLRIQVKSKPRSGRIALKEVRLASAHPGFSQRAPWVEECLCPQGYQGRFCEFCAPGYKREIAWGGPFASCLPCTCNQHGSCDPNSGICQCLHNTEGPACERCVVGFYGNPFLGQPDDCQPCPCPGQGPCATMLDSEEVVCTHCPPGQRGRLCELCDDGFFGDPLGRNGSLRPCKSCDCRGNTDPNAVGNCDTFTGRCLRCLYNTAGEHCERCQEGFYGNPLAANPATKCAPCNCNPDGSTQGPKTCDPVSGQCRCLPNVTGRECTQCLEGYFDLQPGVGCRSCQCHPMGAQSNICHPTAGQCICHPGVTGLSCSQCQAGFFQFSSQGCQACNCSQIGSVSLQCRDNSTCVCKKGFVGNKCEECDANYFFDLEIKQCRECPLCYSLVKEEADRLKDKLTEMEAWFQKPSCDRSKGEYYHAMFGESPRGDNLQRPYLLEGAKAAFLEKMTDLKGLVEDAHHRLSNTSRAIACDSQRATKVCGLLSDVSSTLRSTHEDIQLATEILESTEFSSEISYPSTNWSRHAIRSSALARSHVEIASLVEDLARRAIQASNSSYQLLQNVANVSKRMQEFRRDMEESGEKIEETQKTLVLQIEDAEILVSGHQSNITLVQTNTLELPLILQRPLVEKAGNLVQEAEEIQQLVERKHRLATNKSLAVETGLKEMLQRTQPLEELWQRTDNAQALAESSLANGEAVVSEAKALVTTLDGIKTLMENPKGRAAIRRKRVAVRDRTIAETQRKVRQVQRALGNSGTVSAKAFEIARDGESVSKKNAKAAEDVLRQAKQEKKQASKMSARVALTMAEISRQEDKAKELQVQLGKPEEVVMEMKRLGQNFQVAQRSLEMDIKALKHLLSKLGNLDQSAAVLHASQVQLANLRLRLAGPGSLNQTLGILVREAEQQRVSLEAFEEDLEEIQSDKENLEAILRSLPSGC